MRKKLTAEFVVLFLATVGVGGAQTSGAGSPASSPQRPQVNSPAASNLRDTPLRIAITLDDLPAHNALPPGETRLEVASKIIAALRDAHLPPTYGFVNGLRVEEQPADAAVRRLGGPSATRLATTRGRT